jgi:hypothetical protein
MAASGSYDRYLGNLPTMQETAMKEKEVLKQEEARPSLTDRRRNPPHVT